MRRRIAHSLLWLAQRLCLLAERIDPVMDLSTQGRIVGQELRRSLADFAQFMDGIGRGLEGDE